MCSYKHTHNGAVHIDPDGGRAEMTEYLKNKTLRYLFDNRSNLTRTEWLRGWMSATGMSHYQGITWEGIYSILGGQTAGGVYKTMQDRYGALYDYLGPLGDGFADGGKSGSVTIYLFFNFKNVNS